MPIAHGTPPNRRTDATPPGERSGGARAVGAAPTPPPTCGIRNWRVFEDGFHKGSYFPVDAIHRAVANFNRLRGHLTPIAGLGHDREKRVSLSLGLPNVGEITGCRSNERGDLFLDVTNIPTWLGGMINAHRYRSGSVELLPNLPDPNDPSKQIPGPILSGVAFLGDEQPAVKGCAPPQAVFADGRPVPPNHDPLPVSSEVMSSLFSAAGEPALCFSDYDPKPGSSPMTPEQEAALAAAGFSPEQIAAMKAACPPGATPPAPAALAGESAPPAALPAPAPELAPAPAPASMKPMSQDEMSACIQKMSDDYSDLKKQFSSLAAAREAEEKQGEETKMAAFNSHYEDKIKKNLLTKADPVEIQTVIRPRLKNIGESKHFASAASKYAAADAFLAPYLASRDNPHLVTTNRPAPGTAQPLTPFQDVLVNQSEVLKRAAPMAHAKILEEVAGK